MPVSAPCLSTGDSRFELLAGCEEPRHCERLLRFGTPVEALAFLERVPLTGAARELLARVLRAESRFAVSRMMDREVNAAVAARIVSGEIRVVEQRAPASALAHGGASFRVLRGSERRRAGESPQWFVDRDSAGRFVQCLYEDLWTRRGFVEAARQSTGAAAFDDVRQVLLAFADGLMSGRVRVVRLSLCPAVVPVPPVPLTRVPLAAQRPPLHPGRDGAPAVLAEAALMRRSHERSGGNA